MHVKSKNYFISKIQAIQPKLLMILVGKLNGKGILGQTFSNIVVYPVWLSSCFRNTLLWKFPGTQTWIFSQMESATSWWCIIILIMRLNWVCAVLVSYCSFLTTDITSHFDGLTTLVVQQLFELIIKLRNVLRQCMHLLTPLIFYFSGWGYDIGGT